jgi:hypothetical protein
MNQISPVLRALLPLLSRRAKFVNKNYVKLPLTKPIRVMTVWIRYSNRQQTLRKNPSEIVLATG